MQFGYLPTQTREYTKGTDQIGIEPGYIRSEARVLTTGPDGTLGICAEGLRICVCSGICTWGVCSEHTEYTPKWSRGAMVSTCVSQRKIPSSIPGGTGAFGKLVN